MKISANELTKWLNLFAQFTNKEAPGIYRTALTDADKEARDFLIGKMRGLKLEVHVDAVGNIFGFRKGNSNTPPVAFGSHLDAVPNGGKYDGALGIVAGLMVMEVLQREKIETEKPLCLINFTNEEGIRFTPDMMGSAFTGGILHLQEAQNAKAHDGTEVTLMEELMRQGYLGNFESPQQAFDSYFELHIEQGPILESEQLDVGIVEATQGIFWTEYIFEGMTNHAGTTPLAYRRDAGLAAALMVTEARKMAVNSGDHGRVTGGLIQFEPNQPNIVPGKARVVLDNRHPDKNLLLQSQTILDEYARKVAKENGLKLNIRHLVRFEPIALSLALVELLSDKAEEQNYTFKTMISGAGHDAQMMAHRIPTAMIFVPSKNGISHQPDEFTEPEFLEKGANLLLEAVLARANTK